MRKRKELQGLAVVDVGGGTKLGSVEDLIVSPDDGRILGFTLAGGMLGGRPRTFVDVADVHAIGTDAITVDGDNVARGKDELSDTMREARESNRSLVGNKVITENGTLVGTVSDYFVDEAGRRVTGLAIGGGLLSSADALSADRIRSVGPDAIVVSEEGADTDPGPWSAG